MWKCHFNFTVNKQKNQKQSIFIEHPSAERNAIVLVESNARITDLHYIQVPARSWAVGQKHCMSAFLSFQIT